MSMAIMETTGKNMEKRKVMLNLSPCKDCAARSPGCHGKCIPYPEWAAARRALIARETELGIMLNSSIGDGSRRYILRQRRKNRRKY